MYALAYGLIGGGGNGCFIGSFQFASLFESQARGARWCRGFNVAGHVYLLLNARSISAAAERRFVAALAAAVAVTYPDRAYKPGDTPTLRWPTLGRRRAADDGAGRRRRARRRRRVVPAASVASPPAAAASPRPTRCAVVRPGAAGAPVLGHCATFSWAAPAQWASGAVGSGLIFPGAGVEHRRRRHDQTPLS